MQLKKWTTDQSLEELKIDLENFRRNGVMTATGRFLIGMQLEAEKARNRERCGRSKGKEAERYIAGELNIAQISVRRYARYARSVEAIRKERPALAAELLSGERRLSIQKVVEMAEKKKPGEPFRGNRQGKRWRIEITCAAGGNLLHGGRAGRFRPLKICPSMTRMQNLRGLL